MSRRADLARDALGGAVLAGLVVVGSLLAWRSWDRPVGSGTTTGSAGPVGACVPDASDEGAVRTEAFALGGTVVRAERWCGVTEVVVEVAAAAPADRFVVVASTTRALATLGPSDATRARLEVGPDGWVAIGLVQAEPRALANGGAWVTATAGEPRR